MLNQIALPAGAGGKGCWGCGGNAPTPVPIEKSCVKSITEKDVISSLGILLNVSTSPVFPSQKLPSSSLAKKARFDLQDVASEILRGVVICRGCRGRVLDSVLVTRCCRKTPLEWIKLGGVCYCCHSAEREGQERPRWVRLSACCGKPLVELGKVSYCCKRQVKGGDGEVSVIRLKDGKLNYRGLMTCGSVWLCPVCAAKISEKRRKELLVGVDNWKKWDGTVLLLTLTIPHYAHQNLDLLLQEFKGARERMRNRKTWRKATRHIGLVGSVRSLEVTVGEDNGWHNHTHELLFVKAPLSKQRIALLESELLSAWQSACVSEGLPRPNEHGLKIDNGDKAARYASKWGLDYELTKGHIKQAKQGHYSPFDLLRAYRDTRDERFAVWFREYAKVFIGQRQLFWWQEKGTNLRQLLSLELEQTDEELASAEEEESEVVGTLDSSQWAVVVKARVRFEFLRVVEGSGWLAGLRFVEAQAMRIGLDCQVRKIHCEITENST